MIVLLVLVVFSNFPPLRPFIEIFVFPRPMYYTTIDHGFNDEEILFKGRDYETVSRLFENYKEMNGKPNAVLYRTFPIEPWRFWLWLQYLSHPKYRLPYLEMTEHKATID